MHLDHGRNLAVAASGDAAIAVRGSWGTLAESAFAKLLGRLVVVLEPGWRIDGFDTAAMPAEAVDYVIHALESE